MFIAWFYTGYRNHILVNPESELLYTLGQNVPSYKFKVSLGEEFSFLCAENYLDNHSLFRQSYITISPGIYQHCLTSMSPRLSAPALSKILTGSNEKLMARGVVTRCFARDISKM